MSDDLQAKIDEITQRYQPELDQLQAEGEKMESEAGQPSSGELIVNVDFDVEWKNRAISFTVPTVAMRDRELSLHLPRVEKNRQRIVFDIPTVTMETYCAFKRPVFRGLRVKMECVYLDKPVLRMKRHEIIYDLPEVRMERKTFVLKVPEIGSRRLEMVLKLPQFTARNPRVEAKRLEEKGEELRARAEALAARMEAEVQAVVTTFFGSLSSEGSTLRQEVDNAFSHAIGAIEASIAELHAQNVDASKVPAEGGNVNLRKTLSDLVEERSRAIGVIDTESSGRAGQDPEPAGPSSDQPAELVAMGA